MNDLLRAKEAIEKEINDWPASLLGQLADLYGDMGDESMEMAYRWMAAYRCWPISVYEKGSLRYGWWLYTINDITYAELPLVIRRHLRDVPSPDKTLGYPTATRALHEAALAIIAYRKGGGDLDVFLKPTPEDASNE